MPDVHAIKSEAECGRATADVTFESEVLKSHMLGCQQEAHLTM